LGFFFLVIHYIHYYTSVLPRRCTIARSLARRQERIGGGQRQRTKHCSILATNSRPALPCPALPHPLPSSRTGLAWTVGRPSISPRRSGTRDWTDPPHLSTLRCHCRPHPLQPPRASISTAPPLPPYPFTAPVIHTFSVPHTPLSNSCLIFIGFRNLVSPSISHTLSPPGNFSCD
jgi:hypothetical protein